jgi:hypothetical protein
MVRAGVAETTPKRRRAATDAKYLTPPSGSATAATASSDKINNLKVSFAERSSRWLLRERLLEIQIGRTMFVV